MAADRRQRRAQLVRDAHQEVPLELVGLTQPYRHLAEPVGHLADLAALAARDLDVVAAFGHLVRGLREREDRPREPPGQVPREGARHQDPAQEREREPLDQGVQAVAELGARLRDHEHAEGRAAAFRTKRVRDRQIRPSRRPAG